MKPTRAMNVQIRLEAERQAIICTAGLRTCNDGHFGRMRRGNKKPLTGKFNHPGTCTDSIDNDCDGKTDAVDDTSFCNSIRLCFLHHAMT